MAFKWRGRFFRLHKDSSSSLSDAEIPVEDIPPEKRTKKASVQALTTPQTSIELEQNTKVVSFSTIQVRTYARKLGDSPCCDFPLGLGWRYEETEPTSLEDYDEIHHEDNPDYTCAKRMEVLGVLERKQLLLRSGYTESSLRHEERRRRLQFLGEFLSQSDGMCDWLPPNADILIPRYLCERRNPRWH